MDLQVFATLGLGDNSYLLASGDEAVLVDPQRDAWRFLDAAKAKRVSIHHVLETHVHNDYLSGALETRSITGAQIAVPAKGSYSFPHRPMMEGDEIRIGDLRLVVMETPGHTFEHISWLVYPERTETPVAMFTGGSLLVGSAGRTDLLGPEHTEELARAQFWSIKRLGGLPNEVQVFPTHGAGSFCMSSLPSSLKRTSTVGDERLLNPALAAGDEETFLDRQISNLLAYPRYYIHMGAINQAGPKVLGRLPRPIALSSEEANQRVEEGAWIIDGRDRLSFSQAHVSGSVNVELDSAFGSYVGWVVPFNQRVILVLPEPEEKSLEEAVTQLIRIGYEQVEGYLPGGIEAWQASGKPVRSYEVADIDDLCRAYMIGESLQVLDVRQRTEWQERHIPGSFHLFVGDIPHQPDRIPKGQVVWTICASGHRASIAASLLERAGVQVKLVGRGGVPEWLARCYPG
ncbi:rhodanese-like domain-containing protein [Chloroflexota bacterium]